MAGGGRRALVADVTEGMSSTVRPRSFIHWQPGHDSCGLTGRFGPALREGGGEAGGESGRKKRGSWREGGRGDEEGMRGGGWEKGKKRGRGRKGGMGDGRREIWKRGGEEEVVSKEGRRRRDGE